MNSQRFLCSARPSYLLVRTAAVLLALVGASASSHAQTVSNLMYFWGQSPNGSIIIKKNAQGKDAIFGIAQALTSNDTAPALIGSTSGNGGRAEGQIYEISLDAAQLRTVFQLGTEYDSKLNKIYNGYYPLGSLLAMGEDYYGMTKFRDVNERMGTAHGAGALYRYRPSVGSTLLHTFEDKGVETQFTSDDDIAPLPINADGNGPHGGLITDGNGFLYGVATWGGQFGMGVVFKLNKDGSQFQVLHAFSERVYKTVSTDSAGNPITPSYNTLVPASPKSADFVNPDGAFPSSRLLLGADGYLYGTTSAGGTYGTGTIFKLGKDGSGFQTLVSFDIAEYVIDAADPNFGKLIANVSGSYPRSGLVQAANGNLYGSTSGFGSKLFGTAYCITPTGMTCTGTPTAGLTVIHAFSGTDLTDMVANPTYVPVHDGANPQGELIISADGKLVGTSPYGGKFGYGTLYKLMLDGSSIQLLAEFGDNTVQGTISPNMGVVEVAEGTSYAYYGVASQSNIGSSGALFKYGEPVTAQQGTPDYSGNNDPYDTGGGAMPFYLILMLGGLSLMKRMYQRKRM